MGFEAREQGWRKGPWTPEEDDLLHGYVNMHGDGRWSSVAKTTGLKRSGKSCRLRWVNYLRPGLKRGQITHEEEAIIIELHSLWGNRWSSIARYLPGRTDNEIKNYWRTHFKKREKGSCSNKERRKEYQMLKQKHKQKVEQHEHHHHQQQQQQGDIASSSANNGKSNDVESMEEQRMREESNVRVYMCSSEYNWGWEDHIEQCWPEMVPPPQEDVEEGLWSGLWNLDDSHFGHNNNHNKPSQNVLGPPLPSSSGGGGTIWK